MNKKVRVDFTQLDFRDVKFPSDRLTIEALRRNDWSLFDDGFHIGEHQQPQFFFNGSHGRHAADVLGSMLFCERAVVASAFANRVGAEQPECESRACKDELLTLYAKYGLAKGRNEAILLVKGLEDAGQDMARTGGPWDYRPGQKRGGRE